MFGVFSRQSYAWLVPIVFALSALVAVPGWAVASVAANPGGSLAGHSAPVAVLGAAAPGAGAAPAGHPGLKGLLSPNLLGLTPGTRLGAPWLGALQGSKTGIHPLASLPNLNLIDHPATSVNGAISLGYTAQPAPMGLADYGLGATGPYSISPSGILGQITFSAPPNVTDPGSATVINPGSPNLGNVGSVYEFGLQLNTVEVNVSLPNTNTGVFWTQNVLDINDTGIHFVDDVFNFSAGSGFFIPPASPAPTIVSGCGLTSVTSILATYGGVYQCVGTTIAISPANYPLTIALYNNASVNGANDDQVTFGFEISGAAGLLVSGVYDTVVFNNPGAPFIPPPNPVGFGINGKAGAPVGLLEDAEIVLCGQIGGSNAVFRSLNATMNLETLNAGTGAFQSVKSAYNFGSDTGETSTGVTGYWKTAGTEYVNQGPTLLYGLWGAIAKVSVAAGSIEFKGSIAPSYGFVFVSNVLLPGPNGTNMSWVPTTNAGTFDTYLPPAVPPALSYSVQAFAAGYLEKNGTPFLTSQTAYTISLTASARTLNAPLYMFGNAQAASLASAVLGATAPPYNFNGLVVKMNFTFNHLNDFGFPSFVIFSAQSVTVPFSINGVTQGGDSNRSTFYVLDFGSGPLLPPPRVTGSLPGYSQQFNIFGATGTTVTNEVLPGEHYAPGGTLEGGLIFLWQDTNAAVTNVVSGGAYGVFVGDSTGTVVHNVVAVLGGNGVDDVGSIGTQVWNASGAGPGSFGVFALSTWGATYTWLNGSFGGVGLYAGTYFGQIPYYAVPGTANGAVRDVNGSLGGTGASLAYSQGVAVNFVSAALGGQGLVVLLSGGIVAGTVSSNGGLGVYNLLTDGTSVSGITASNGGVGAVFVRSNGVIAYSVTASTGSIGVGVESSSGASVSIVTASSESVGAFSALSTGTTIHQVTASNPAPFSPGVGAGVFDLPGTAAVVTADDQRDIITNVSATSYSAAWLDVGSVDTVATALNATSSEFAAILNGTSYATISAVGAYLDTVGIQMNGAVGNAVTTSAFVGDMLWGIDIESGSGNLAWMNNFVGDHGASTSYSVLHIQAFSSAGNSFNSGLIGNYWADWHTYGPTGTLAPYYLSGGVWDYYPLGTPEGTYTVNFIDQGLPASTMWSVTLNGVAQSSSASTISFVMAPGTYQFTSGAVLGYTASPASGSVTVLGGPVSQTVSYAPLYAFTFSETGLPSGTSWTFQVGGDSVTGTAASGGFNLPGGTYQFTVHPVAGYAANPSSGTVTLSSEYALSVTFSPVLYPVTLSAGGLSPGTVWSATVGSLTQSTSGSALTFYVPNGSYAYAFGTVSGYTLTGGSGSVTVNGQPLSVGTSYAAPAGPSLATSSSLTTDFTIGLVVAVIALVVALVAVFRRPPARPAVAPYASSEPAAPTPPPKAASTTSSSSSWSEGPPDSDKK